MVFCWKMLRCLKTVLTLLFYNLAPLSRSLDQMCAFERRRFVYVMIKTTGLVLIRMREEIAEGSGSYTYIHSIYVDRLLV